MKLFAVLLLVAAAVPAQTWKDFVKAGAKALRARDYQRAELLLIRGEAEAAKFGEADPRHVAALNLLGSVFRAEHKLPEAEAAYRRLLPVAQKLDGPQSLDAGNALFNIGRVQADEGKCAEALDTFGQALPVFERWFGAGGAKTAEVIYETGECERKLGHFTEAGRALERAAALREANDGVDSPELADVLQALGLTYTSENQFAKADGAFRLALTIREKALGLESQPVRETLEAYSGMLRKAGRPKEAERMSVLAQAIDRTWPRTP